MSDPSKDNKGIELKLIAEQQANLPPSQWPQHNPTHKRRLWIVGELVFDDGCLRCWIEKVVADRPIRYQGPSTP